MNKDEFEKFIVREETRITDVGKEIRLQREEILAGIQRLQAENAALRAENAALRRRMHMPQSGSYS